MPLPSGVTLQQIDGGPNYYSVSGFTNAVSAGWDNGVIPIGPWLAPMLTQSDATRWHDLDFNTAYAFTGNSNMSLFSGNHISAIVNSQELSQILSNNGGVLPGIVGLLSMDEPGTFQDGVSTPIGTTANSIQDHNFWWINNTWNFIVFGGLNGTPAPGDSATVLDTSVATPDGALRHIDEQSIDLYWFAGANVSSIQGQGGQVENGFGAPAFTPDQMARGSNYGDMIDSERAFQTGHFPAPITAFVEDGGPYTEDTSASNYITPPELNWAVWSSLIHGARNIVYFNHSFAGPAQSQDNLNNSYYQTVQPGQTTSIYNQVKATDALVEQMGPELTAPVAIGYVHTSGPGYNDLIPDHTQGGIETSAHLYNGNFYIFADTRDSMTQTNIPATFILNDPTATSVTVLNEGRSIPVVNGQFTDTFATAATVHIYQVVENGTPPPPPPATPTILSLAPDTPPVGDGHTTATSITLTGTAEAGSTVKLFDGATAAGSTTADSGGNWNILDNGLTVNTHNFTATDTDINGTSAASLPFTVTVDPTSTTTYSTTFPTVENPVSDGGHLITSTSPGVNWSGLKLGGSGTLPVSPVDVVAPGEAESVNFANSNFGDALAVATGTWTADQSASVVVGNIPAQPSGTEEFEIHLRTNPTTGAGYEVSWAYNSDYILVATWHATGGYTNLYFAQGSQYAVHQGDTLTASIKGNVITMYDNGVQEAQITDSTFTSGNPGFGFNQGGTSAYDISSFSAIDLGTPPPPPAAPVISSFSPDTGGIDSTSSTLTLSGTAPAKSTVTVFDGSTDVGTATADTNGNWSFGENNVTNGTHTFTATDTTSAGASAVSSPFVVTVNVAPPPPPGNLVVNGSFETGDFTGWQLTGVNPNQTFIVTAAEQGNFAAALGTGGGEGNLTQTLHTVVGQQYSLDFWLANVAGSGSDNFSAIVDGQTLFQEAHVGAQPYTEHQVTFTATNTSTVLEFAYHNGRSEWHLDNIVVETVGSTTTAAATAHV